MLAALLTLAVAAPQPLARVDDGTAFALAGDRALYTTRDARTLRVLTAPGGRTVFTYTPPKGTTLETPNLAASAQRAAIALVTGESEYAQAFAGPPEGPWTALTPVRRPARGEPFAYAPLVDGPNVFTLDLRGLDEAWLTAYEPSPRRLALPSGPDAIGARFAGDLVAYGEVGRRRLVVRNWRTGAVVTVADLKQPPATVDVLADGRAVVATDDEQLLAVAPGGAPRRLARAAQRPRFAGEHVVFERRGGLRVLEPGGRVRAFGVPTRTLAGFVTDGGRVLWQANGCLLIAAVTEPAAAAPPRGPCPRSELQIPEQSAQRLRSTPAVRLRCVAAPLGACRGTLRLRRFAGHRAARTPASVPLRFRIPAGRQRTLRVRLTRRAIAALRRAREPVLRIEAATRDGERVSGPPDLFLGT